MAKKPKPDYYLSDKQELILRTKLMRMPVAKALTVLEVHNYPTARSTYFENLKVIKEKTHARLIQIAKHGMEDRHLLTLDTLQMCEAEYWENYLAETDHYKRTVILDKIVQLQPWLSTYIDETQDIIEKQLASQKVAETTPPDSIASPTAKH